MTWLFGADAMSALQSAPALLPAVVWLPVLLQVGWALVSAAAVLLLCRFGGPRRFALPLALSMGFWCVVPGPWGASYWLGLAFQTPSVMAQLLALRYLWSHWPDQAVRSAAWLGSLPADRLRTDRFVAAGLVLGWCLLLDTFGYLPVALYGWGFHPVTAALLLLLALLPWVANAQRTALRGAPAALLGVLAVFGVTRWPTGNVWDAVLDPWLFVGLHFYLVARYRANRRA